MGLTKIQWTEQSVNPIRTDLLDAEGNVIATGHHCEKISPGCKFCYASRLQPRFQLPPFDRRQGVELRHRLDEKVLESVLRRRKPTKYFWCDMTDMFGDWVERDWYERIFQTMAATPQHTHQVLTKRPDLALEAMQPLGHVSRPLPNVHLGVSVESPDYLWRVDVLRKIAPAVPWVSYEPALAAVDFTPYLDFLKWIVIGGESGPGARPFDLHWIVPLAKACADSGTALFVKQAGSKPYLGRCADSPVCQAHPVEWLKLKDSKGGDLSELPEWARVREYPA